MKKINLSMTLIFLAVIFLLSSCAGGTSNNSSQNAESRKPSEIIAGFPDTVMELKGYKNPVLIDYRYYFPQNDIESETVGNANTYYTVSYKPDDPKAVFSFYQQLLGDTESSQFASGTIGKYDIFVDFSRTPEIEIVFESFESKILDSETFKLIAGAYIPSKYFVMYTFREIQIMLDSGQTYSTIGFTYKKSAEELTESYKNLIKNAQLRTQDERTYIAGDEKDSKFFCDIQISNDEPNAQFSAVEQTVSLKTTLIDVK